MANEEIGIRMKERYEDRTRYMLPRRTWTILRLDGKAFHTYTRKIGAEKPFDRRFMTAMSETAIRVCEELQGAKIGYVQSDEISILLTDFSKPMTSALFDGNIQKICSVSASIASVTFNAAMNTPNLRAYFDSRVFTIPDPVEVENYFIWRQQDATRNSIQMVAQSLYSHKELNEKNCSVLQEMIHQKGQNWNDYPVSCKRGTAIVKREVPVSASVIASTTSNCKVDVEIVKPQRWVSDEPPIFTQDRTYLHKHIPLIGDWLDDVAKPSTVTVTVNSTDKPKDIPKPEGMPGVV